MENNETYYFSHDGNARNDEKILMLRADHGWEGYGIYWALVEMMFENKETCLSHNKIKGIAVSYNIDITVLESVINTCITENLFVSDDDKFWSESLRKRKGKYHEMKRKKSEAGKKGMAKRWSNKRSDNTVITKDNTVITKDNKGKESKVNKSKVKESIYRQFKHLSLTEKEFEKLIIEGYNKENIDEILDRIENFANNKKYTSLILTARNWLKKEKPKAVEHEETSKSDNDKFRGVKLFK